MNIANTVASKLFVAFVAASMLLMLAAPAKAATADAAALQARIDALMAELKALTGDTAPAATAGCTFTRALTVGSQGPDVKCLQDYLTPTYFSNAGGSTGYFGPVTAAAVASWQTANGIAPAAGYFGPVSQAKYNAMMAMTDDSDDSDDDMDDSDSDDSDSDSDDDMSSGDLSGEADLKSFDIEDGEDVELEEGQTEESVMDFVIEFQDGDAVISRLDINFDTNATDDLWDVLGEVTLYVDGDEVKTIDGSDEDNYQSDDETLRFSGLDVVSMEDDETTITLGVEVQDNLDDNTQVVTVDVPSMRFVDADEVTSTEDPGATTNTFSIAAAGSEDELLVKNNTSADPDAKTLVVEEDTIKSDWYTIFAFDLDTDDSINDIELNHIAVRFDVGTAQVDMVVEDAELVIDGVSFDDWDWSSSTDDDNSRDMTFDIDGDHTIDAGDRVTAELKVRFFGNNAGAQFAEGETIVASASTSLFRAEGVEDVTTTGGSTGERHTLRSTGVSVEEFTSTEVATAGAADDGSYGTYTIEFDVLAIGEDEIYVPLTASVSDNAGSSTKGAVYSIQTSNADIASTSADALSASLTRVSGGDTSTSGYVRLDSGDSATFKLIVTFNPGTVAAQYTAILRSVGFAATAAPATSTVLPSPATDFDSDPLYITS